MKTPFILCALTVALLPLSASAQRKGMGPSAIEAARLKKYPPPNYLSHYLPDDRYKIAGKVWKYVSTDLDTYYHLPSSANMLRQPASRVIGFANAKDAEEAGYVADPTDGTANSVAASAPRSKLMPNTGGMGFSGRGSALNSVSAAEKAYLMKIAEFQIKYGVTFQSLFDKAASVVHEGDSNAEATSKAMPYINQGISTLNTWVDALNRLKPPPRFQVFHALYRSSAETLQLGATQFKQSLQTESKPLMETATRNINKGIALFSNSFKLLPK